MINTIAAIALGGALGALMRHGVNISALTIMGQEFPYGTLAVNIVGSFIMGIAVIAFANIVQPSETLRLFLMTGVLGAFTTFSTFSLDVVNLLERADYWNAGIYLSASVILSIVALVGGMAFMRVFVS